MRAISPVDGIAQRELVQVVVESPHRVLAGHVQGPEGVRRGDFDGTPDPRFGVIEGHGEAQRDRTRSDE